MNTALGRETEGSTARHRWSLSDRDRVVLGATFSIDTRALSVVRILLAAWVLFNSLVVEWSRPRDPTGPLSFLSEYGDLIVVPFAFMMLVGFRARVATVVVWVLFALHPRASLFAGVPVDLEDHIANLALFWAMFLPMGRHLSLDARNNPEPAANYLSVGTAALLLQLFIIYVSAGVVKSMGEWLVEANALELVLAHPKYATPLGSALLGYPWLLAAASRATVILEVLGPLLLIVPGKSLSVRRMVVVPLFLLLEFGIGLLMGLWAFALVMMALWLVFLPPVFWDRMWGWSRPGPEPLVAEFDSSRWRNGLAALAVAFATVTFVNNWVFFPEFEGTSAEVKEAARYSMLDQQWFMFSLPSSLPDS